RPPPPADEPPLARGGLVERDDVRAELVDLELELVDLAVPGDDLARDVGVALGECADRVDDRPFHGRSQAENRLLEALFFLLEVSFVSVHGFLDLAKPARNIVLRARLSGVREDLDR